MKIGALNSINNYSKVVSDYKSARRKITPECRAVTFKNNDFEIKTGRKIDDISQFIIDTKKINTQSINKKETQEKEAIKKYDRNLALLRKAPILERFDYVIGKLKQGEYISATTMGILSIIYGPEDLREVGSAYEQIKSLLKGVKPTEEYNYKIAQHPYSFFRGSILHRALNPFVVKNVDYDNLSEFGKWWHRTVINIKRWLVREDKALIDTKLGEKVLKIFNIDIKRITTPIEEITQDGIKKNLVDAYQFISDSKFGNLTARAMTRVPVIGTIADATIEALEIKNDIKDGENFFESTGKAIVRYTTSTLITSYFGAVGSKLGPVGSLGSIVLANYISDKIEKTID